METNMRAPNKGYKAKKFEPIDPYKSVIKQNDKGYSYGYGGSKVSNVLARHLGNSWDDDGYDYGSSYG